MKNTIRLGIASLVLASSTLAPAAPVSDAEKHHSTAMNAASYAAADRAENGFRILFIGNSITLHGSCPSIGWTNVWGMAASAREKDFVHLVTRELERRFARKADLKVVNYADFERGFRTWDFKKTAELVAFDPDVLVFALGENVTALPTEKDRLAWCDAFKKLIGAFLEGKRTKPLAVVRGSFWPDKTKDWAMAHAASDCGIPFVKADVYGIPGMDATGCGFTHPGVQAHPGDKGMAEIAARILEGLLPEKTDFKVQVDGKPAKVVATTLSAMEYNRCFGDGGDYQRPADQTERGALVQVEATGATTWRVKVARPFKKVVVRPLSANVRPKVEGGDVCFTLPKCGFYVLELDDFHNPLEIFVEPKNDFADYRKTATITFGPGIHLTRGVALKSHDRVYLDKDAVVYGGFELNGVEDVEIRGYGTIIGTTCRRGSDYLPCVGNDGKKQRPSPLTPIRAKLSKKITIEGPVVLDACEWCVATFGCEDVEVSHLKVTGAWRYNTDGIDFCNTRNVHLHDSYLHAFDDVVVLKGYVSYKDMPVENVKVERCVCWCSWGRTLENGLETWASAWRNVVFEDCDLIHNSMGALSVHLGGPCVVGDITYRKLRLEYDASRSEAEYQRGRDKPYAKAAMKPSSGNWLAIENNKMFHPGSFYKNPLVSPDEPHGSFKKVTVEDIDITVEPGVPEPRKHVSFQGGVKLGEVVLKNVRVNGRPVTACATVSPDDVLAEVSPNVYGLGMEDVNHEIYGGLDAQRLYGESFEEPPIPWDGKGNPIDARRQASGCWKTSNSHPGELVYDTSVAHSGRASQALKPNGSVVGVGNCGLGNAGISVRKDRALVGWIHVRGKVSVLEVGLRAAKGWTAYATAPVATEAGDVWKRVEFRLVPTADDPAAMFTIKAQGYGTVWVDDVYLADEPTNAFGRLGCREDVVAVLQESGVNFLRWGGTMCNAEDYLLKNFDGTRKPYRGFWHEHSSGGFGPREFVRLAAAMNVPCAFSISAREDVAEAARLAEELKKHDTPIVVEIGNEECIGCWDAAAARREYCDRARTLVTAMRQANPKLQFATALWWDGLKDDFDQLDGVVEYWDLHPFFSKPEEAVKNRGVVRDFMKKIREWNPNTTMKAAVFEENGTRHDMSRALCHALMLEEIRAAGKDVLTSCPANAFQVWKQNDNGWDQGNVFMTPDKAWLSPCGWSQRMARDGHRELLVASASDDAAVHVSAVRDRAGKSLVLHFVNACPATKYVSPSVKGAAKWRVAKAVSLAGKEGLSATNVPDDPKHVAPVDVTDACRDVVTLKPWSYTVVTLESRAAHETADRAVLGDVTVINIPWKFKDGKIDWLFNPTAKNGPFNPEWTWQLNRMDFWPAMAKAYAETRDEKYARAFVAQLEGWLAQTGGVPSEEDGYNDRGSPWRTIEEGLRLMRSWPVAWDAFKDSPSFPEPLKKRFLEAMRLQAKHLMAHRTGQNWLLMEMNGVYTFASKFPQFPECAGWRRDAARIFCDAIRAQILPDGMHNELSPDYHCVALMCALPLYETAKRHGFDKDLPADYLDVLRLCAEGPIALTTPALTQPRFNDCFTVHLPGLVREISRLFPERQDFRWAATGRREGEAPKGDTASRFLPWSGFAAMRTDWGPDATYLCFDVGPLGASTFHSHQDKLSFNLYKGGEELVFEDGGGQYEDSDMRRHGVSGYDHNVLLVDGLAQHRREPLVADKPVDCGWETSAARDRAFGVYDQGFGPDEKRLAKHRREIVLDKKSGVVTVADDATSADGGEHVYQLLFQLDTTNTTVSADGRRLVAHFGRRYDLQIDVLEGGAITTASAQRAPRLAGWFVGRNDMANRPATTVFVSAPKCRDRRFVTAFKPVAASKR